MKIEVTKNVAILTLTTFIFAGGFSWIQYSDLKSERNLLLDEKAGLEERVASLELALGITEEDLSRTAQERSSLVGELTSERERVVNLGDQVSELSETVDVLDRLSKTDKELLQKYSKVFFLNEHYVPEALASINIGHRFNVERDLQVHAKVLPYLEKMLNDATDAGVRMYVQSAYRSFGEQSSLKHAYKTIYGAGTANQFSADQGYSEHQLGTTIDLTTLSVGAGLDGFDRTPQYQWLRANAHKYGFTMSYPPGNAYYIFEPWHWRFVGVALATRLHQEGKFFYDLEQREIDKYLINIFD